MADKYPEHEKLAKIKDRSQTIGEFVDWLQNEKSYILASWNEDRHAPRLYPAHVSTERLLAQYFDIDLVIVEQERRSMLKEMRASQPPQGGSNG